VTHKCRRQEDTRSRRKETEKEKFRQLGADNAQHKGRKEREEEKEEIQGQADRQAQITEEEIKELRTSV
jgi:hypothetical protein